MKRELEKQLLKLWDLVEVQSTDHISEKLAIDAWWVFQKAHGGKQVALFSVTMFTS